MNTGNGPRQNQHVGRIQQQMPGNPNFCQFQYVGMPVHHQGLKSNQFSPTQIRSHGYIGNAQSSPVQAFPVATNMATPLVARTFPGADILTNFNQMGPPRPTMQYKTINNWPSPIPQNTMTLPSIGSLWSHFQQQQHNKQNLQQQQQHQQHNIPPQHLTYLPSQPPQHQFINTPDGLALCGNPNIQYGFNHNPAATVNHNLNYGGFVLNRLQNTGQNPQIINTHPTGIALGHQGMIPSNILTTPELPQSSMATSGFAQPHVNNFEISSTNIASSSNQVTTPTTTVTVTSSTGTQVTETATVHCRVPVSSVICPPATSSKPQTLLSHTSIPGTLPTVLYIKIPFGWKRIVEDNQIVYYSPSNVKLCNKAEICKYLLLEGSCKCGLECPLLIDAVFNFDVNVVGQSWSVEEASSSKDLSNLCNHKRKIIALAKFQQSQILQKVSTTQSQSDGNVEMGISERCESKGNVNLDATKLTMPFSPNMAHARTSNIPFCPSSEPDFIMQPNMIGQNHRMLKFMDMPSVQMNPFETATKPRTIRKRKPRIKKSRTPDPAADLGPITCHVPQKLDFSQDNYANYRFKADQINCHMQPTLSPNDFQQGLVSPQGLLSPQGLVTPPSVFSPQSHGMKNSVVFQTSASANAMPSGNFLNQSPPITLSKANLQSQYQLPVNVQTNNGLMFQQMMPMNNPISHRLENNELYNQTNPYQQNVLCNMNMNNYTYPQLSDMWMESPTGKPKSKRPRGKKDKHKLNSIVDRTSLCPNVDARILSKTPEPSTELSFLENPTAFLAQQTVLVNNSINSPLTQPKDINHCNIKTENRKFSPKIQTTTLELKKLKETKIKEETSFTATESRPPIILKISTKSSGSDGSNTSDYTVEGVPEKESTQKLDVKVKNSDDSQLEEKIDATLVNDTFSNTIDPPNSTDLQSEQENPNIGNVQQIINSGSEQNEFPASSLLSAAARAQISQHQPTANIIDHNNINSVTNTVPENTNIQDWMNKIMLANSGTPNNIPVDQQVLLQQNPHLFNGGLVNAFNGMAGLPLNMFFPFGQPVDPSALSPSNVLLNVNQQVPLIKQESTPVTTQTLDPLKNLLHVQSQNTVPAGEIPGTEHMVSINTPMPRISVPLVSNVTNSLSQVIPTVGVTQPILNQQPFTQMFGGMTFPAMNSLFVANPIANQTNSQNITVMDVLQQGDQSKQPSKTSPTTGENIGITNNMPTAINQDFLNQLQKTDQMGNGANQQLLFLPNISIPMMQVLGSSPFIQQTDVDKMGLQNGPQYMVSNPAVDPTGQFCANQQNPTNLLQLLGMQQALNNFNTVGNLTPAQLQTLHFQQLLLQQLQGMQTLVNQINLQTVSQQGLDNSLHNSGSIKTGGESSETGDDAQSETDRMSLPERQDIASVSQSQENIELDSSNQMTESVSINSNVETETFSQESFNCVPKKTLKNKPVTDHEMHSLDLKNHVDNNNSCESNHVTSDIGVSKTVHKPAHHHYNGEITLVNTNTLKRSRNDDFHCTESVKRKRDKLHKIFNNGDLVWGEIAGSNWPGKLINCNNHILSDTNYTNGEDKVLVKWFGDHGESRVDLVQLKSWDEGLIAHKMGHSYNATLEAAIQEALQGSGNDLPLLIRKSKKKKT